MKKLFLSLFFVLALIVVSSTSSFAYSTIYVKGSWDSWVTATALTYNSTDQVWEGTIYISTSGDYEFKYWIGDPNLNNVFPEGGASTNVAVTLSAGNHTFVFGDSASDLYRDVIKVDGDIYNDTDGLVIKKVQGIKDDSGVHKITLVSTSSTIASTIDVHYSVNSGTWVQTSDYSITADLVSSYQNGGGTWYYQYTIEIPSLSSGDNVEYAVTDGNGNWDNNDGQNYQQEVD